MQNASDIQAQGAVLDSYDFLLYSFKIRHFNNQKIKTQLCTGLKRKKKQILKNILNFLGVYCGVVTLNYVMASSRMPFDTVATYNDKRNNNSVSVNIALHRISPQKPPPASASISRPVPSSISTASSLSNASSIGLPITDLMN